MGSKPFWSCYWSFILFFTIVMNFFQNILLFLIEYVTKCELYIWLFLKVFDPIVPKPELHCRCNDGAKKRQSFIKLTFEFTLYCEVCCFQYCCTFILVGCLKWTAQILFFLFFCIKKYVCTLVFCYQNCSDLLWEKNVLVIEKNFWNSRLKAKNLPNFWDH